MCNISRFTGSFIHTYKGHTGTRSIIRFDRIHATPQYTYVDVTAFYRRLTLRLTKKKTIGTAILLPFTRERKD